MTPYAHSYPLKRLGFGRCSTTSFSVSNGRLPSERRTAVAAHCADVELSQCHCSGPSMSDIKCCIYPLRHTLAECCPGHAAPGNYAEGKGLGAEPNAVAAKPCLVSTPFTRRRNRIGRRNRWIATGEAQPAFGKTQPRQPHGRSGNKPSVHSAFVGSHVGIKHGSLLSCF
jgi:hypothetical protein